MRRRGCTRLTTASSGCLPVDAVGRVGEAVVEGASGEQVVGEGVAELDVSGVLALGDHVALADGVGLVVDLLPVQVEAGVGVAGLEVLVGDREHAAGAGGGVVDGADDALLGERVAVFGEHQVDGEADGVARGEVLTGGLVGGFGELADEFLEEVAHLGVRRPRRGGDRCRRTARRRCRAGCSRRGWRSRSRT